MSFRSNDRDRTLYYDVAVILHRAWEKELLCRYVVKPRSAAGGDLICHLVGS